MSLGRETAMPVRKRPAPARHEAARRGTRAGPQRAARLPEFCRPVEQLESRTLMAAQWDRPDFGGNPYAAVSAIDATDTITTSRGSGEVPFFVQASASAISATGTSRPYEDLEYKWNFGDSAGTETLTNPATGETVNANTGQTGPEAAYVYRTAATYTITLTVRGRTSTGTYVTEDFQKSVTASAWNGAVIHYDPVSGSDSNAGTDPNFPKRNLPVSISNQWVKVKRGTTIIRAEDGTANGEGVLLGNHTRLSSYGDPAAAAPIIEERGSGDVPLRINNASARDDIVVSDIDLRADSATGSPTVVMFSPTGGTNAVTNVYFDNVKASSEASAEAHVFDVATNKSTTNAGLWKTDVKNTGVSKGGVYGIATAWGFVVGGEVSGPGRSTDSEYDHHIYPQMRQHALFRWIDFGTGVNRNYAINVNAYNPNATGTYSARYFLLSDNFVSGTKRAFDASETSNDATKLRFYDFVVQGNALTGLNTSRQIFWNNLAEGTIRDNVAWGNNGILMSLDAGALRPFSKPYVYQNLVHASGDPAFLMENLTQAYLLRGNVVHDTSSTAIVAYANTNEPTGTVINNNQWYTPNDTNDVFSEVETGSATLTFAEWQAGGFDANGTFGVNPGWVDPANGNFLTAGSVPPTPANFDATKQSSSLIRLTWGDVSREDGYKIERKLSGTDYVQIATVAAGVTTYDDTNLPPNVNFRYRVRAYNASGNSGYSNDNGSTTNPPSNSTLLTAPGSFSAAANGSASTIDLTWINVSGETGYLVERKLGDTGAWAQIQLVTANATS